MSYLEWQRELIGKDDHSENGWMASIDGVRKILYTSFVELHVLEKSDMLLLRRRQEPTGQTTYYILMNFC